jgi:hypothetical protein
LGTIRSVTWARNRSTRGLSIRHTRKIAIKTNDTTTKSNWRSGPV